MAITKQTSNTDLPEATTLAEALEVMSLTTPSTRSSAHQLFSEIRDIYTTLTELSSLAPSETVNTLLTRLVNLCVAPYSTEFTTCFFKIPGAEELCERLRSICSTAESELEKYYVKQMLGK